VKPGNVILDDRGQAMLMDFGLARMERAEEKLTHEGSIMGTPAYMAPEQADASLGEVGAASDQYSLGVVLYELLCGETPFSGPPAVLLFNAVHSAPKRPGSTNPAIPKDLDTICMKAISKRPAERYPDCGELAEDLRRWLGDEPIRARRMGLAEQTVRWVHRNPLVASLVATVFLITCLGLAAVTWQWSRAEGNRQAAEWNRRQEEVQRQKAESNLREAERQTRLAEKNEAEARIQKQNAERAQAEAEKNLGEAIRQGKEADDARKKAQDALASAEKASREAVAAREQAVKNLAEAEAQRKLAQEREQSVRRNLYVAEMNLARQAIDAGNAEYAGQLLNRHAAYAPGEEDLRGFEWYYLAAQVGLVGRPKAEPLKHGEPVYAVSLAADGATAISLGKDRMVKSWDLTSLKPTAIQTFPADFVWGNATPFHSRVLSVSKGATTGSVAVQRADVRGVIASQVVGLAGPIAISRRDAMAAVATSAESTQRVSTVTMHTGSEITSPSSQKDQGVAFTPESRQAVAAFRQVVVWSGEKREGGILPNCSNPLVFLPDGKRLAAMALTHDARVRGTGPPQERPDALFFAGVAVWNLDTGNIEMQLDYTPNEIMGLRDRAWISSIHTAPDGQTLATVERDWSRALIQAFARKSGQNSPPGVEGKAGLDRTVFWALSAAKGQNSWAKRLCVIPAASDLMAFTDDAHKAVIVEQGGRAALWDLATATAEPLGAVEGDQIEVAPRGRTLAVWFGLASEFSGAEGPRQGGQKKSDQRAKAQLNLESRKDVQLWDLEAKRLRAVLGGHKYAVRAGAFAPDGRTFATGSEDGTVKLWDVATGMETCTLKGHTGGVLALAFSHDGAILASGSRDGTVRIWRGPRTEAAPDNTYKK
jgi:multidrug efflux pump subunit AcrA (membrane-fusion protein)